MNASGSLLYASLQNGVDIFDTNHGSWIGRFLLKGNMPIARNSMGFDDAGNRSFLIGSTGLTVVELASPPLSFGYAGGLFMATNQMRPASSTAELRFLVEDGEIRATANLQFANSGNGTGLKFKNVFNKDQANFASMT
jgi:hypothetical protein